MRRKIFLFAALLAGLAVAATSILTTRAAHDNFLAGIRQEVRAEASYIRQGYELAGETYLDSLEYPAGHRLTLIAPDGTVLYDNTARTGQMDNHLDRPEVSAALTDGSGESTRYSDTVREQTYYYALRLGDGAVLRLASTTVSMLAAYDRLFSWVAWIALLVIAAAAAIASYITRKIIQPINAIDLEHPEYNVVYEEILPLLRRVKEQRDQINEHVRALDRGRREFSAITENMSEGFLVLDRSGKILSHNKSAVRLLDMQSADATGSNILALNRSEGFRNMMWLALEGETREQVMELHGRQCQIFANPVTEGGSLRGLVLLLLDVTEKQERDKLRSEFTANVSHELKTPLTAISGYAELMAGGMVKAKDLPAFSQNLYREAQYLIALVNDLLFLSGLEESKALVKEPADLLAACAEAARRLTPLAAEYEVTLTVEGEPATVPAIPSVLDEIVCNLIENAVKYNRRGGSVRVTVNKDGQAAILSVADTGPGIPKAEQERIFERFYRVDKSRNRAIPGTGLGLAIVKHGASLLGAGIDLDSDEKGSCFTLAFPAEK